jgi:hypothetical protein
MHRSTLRRTAAALLLGAALPAGAGAQDGFQQQTIAELHTNVSAVADSSVLNPGNAAELGGVRTTLRLYPAAELRHGWLKLRADARFSAPLLNAEGSRAGAELQEGYAGVALGDAAYLAAGRQRLGWGTGLIWNPTRIDAEKDPLRTSSRLRGIDAVRLEYAFSGATLNVLAAAPDVTRAESSRDLLYAARLETRVAGVATSLSAVNPGRSDWRLGWDFSAAADRFTVYGEGTLRRASELPVVDGAGSTVRRGESGRVMGAHHDVVLGTLLSLSPRWSGMVEYQYRSDAWSGAEYRRFVDDLPRSGPLYDALGPGRHRVFGMARMTGDEGAWSVALKGFADPVSGTFVLSPTLERSGSRFKAEISPQLFLDRDAVSPYRTRTQVIVSAFF